MEETWRRYRAITIQQERKVHAALQYAASFHCIVEESQKCEELKPIAEEKKVEARKHRLEWCATAGKYRCMRCGRDSNNIHNILGNVRTAR